MSQTIITAAAVAAAIIALVGYYNKIYGFVKHQNDQDKTIADLKVELQDSRNELALIIDGLSACLDGLIQLGANHTVPTTKKQIEQYINQRAHK